MIKPMNNNDLVAAVALMDKTTKPRDFFGYSRNETRWTKHLIQHIEKSQEMPDYLAIKDEDEEGNLRGFMLASVYQNYYDDEPIMDVKDCIVDDSLGKVSNAKSVKRLFDAMISHTKAYGGKHWRADSVRGDDENKAYSEFLQRHYNCSVRYSTRGIIE